MIASTSQSFDQSEIVFTHADKLGIALHIVLTETENESLFEALDGTTASRERQRPEISRRTTPPSPTPASSTIGNSIARFAHHPAIVWNLGEENGGGEDRFGKANTTEQRKAFASYIRSIDPYPSPDRRPHVSEPVRQDLRAAVPGFDAISGPSSHMGDPKKSHAETLKWIKRSREAKHPWFVCIDEIGPRIRASCPTTTPIESNHKLAREVLWGNLLAGGSGVEWYFGYKYHDNDLNCEDFRSRENVWKFTKSAIDFFHEHLPFDEMESADDLINTDGEFCFAKASEVYAAYLPSVAEAR